MSDTETNSTVIQNSASEVTAPADAPVGDCDLQHVVSREAQAVELLKVEIDELAEEEKVRRRRRRQFRFSLLLFVLTFCSTTLVGAKFWPIHILPGFFNNQTRVEILVYLNAHWGPDNSLTLADRLWQSLEFGFTYSVPLMLILFSHEMGHFLLARFYRIPASYPLFIPLPLPPLGTMGAVILQQRGVADRRQMFDMAIAGPLAGLVVTIPILIYGIMSSGYVPRTPDMFFEFGQPKLVSWLITTIHGEAPAGMSFQWNGYASAGWVGVFLTAMNLLPVGQLDGGHILYTMIRRHAHWIAWMVILGGVFYMIQSRSYSYLLLLILLTLTGPRHPPTRDDTVTLGWKRHVLGALSIAFLLIGFTFRPIILPGQEVDTSNTLEPVTEEQLEQLF